MLMIKDAWRVLDLLPTQVQAISLTRQLITRHQQTATRCQVVREFGISVNAANKSSVSLGQGEAQQGDSAVPNMTADLA